jgi:threonine aldolase
MAKLLGKPAALFFPTGTMAQQVALRLHAERLGRPAFAAHPQNHLDLGESKGYSVVHGLRFVPVGDRQLPLTLGALQASVHEPIMALVLELPQRNLGGTLPSWEELRQQTSWARTRGAVAHLDGARLWEAQPFYDRPYSDICSLFDTVYVSLYKALGGIRGGILAGDEDLIDQARVWRHRLGGAIDDAWPLAVAAQLGMDELLPRMPEFHRRALDLATALRGVPGVRITPDPPMTSMFHVHVDAGPEAVERAAARILEEHGVQLFLDLRRWPIASSCSFEVCVGENAMQLSVEETSCLISELVENAISGNFD